MTPEFLNNEIFLELCKSLLSILAVLFIFVLLVVTIGGVNNRDRYRKCPICGKSMSSESKLCRDCNYKSGGKL